LLDEDGVGKQLGLTPSSGSSGHPKPTGAGISTGVVKEAVKTRLVALEPHGYSPVGDRHGSVAALTSLDRYEYRTSAPPSASVTQRP